MGDWPVINPLAACELGGRSGTNSWMVELTSGLAPSKGAYVQLIASTLFRYNRIVVYPSYSTDSGLDFLVDIAIGAAGSEVIILADLFKESWGQITALGPIYDFNIDIPAGTRISARCAGYAYNTKKTSVGVHLMNTGFYKNHLGIVDNYGLNAADCGGVSIDPGGTANTKGAWSQITASTTRTIRELMTVFGNQRNTGRALYHWLVDIGIGGAGSEVVIIPDIPFNCGANLTLYPVNSVLYPVAIPAGTRLSVRAMCSGNDATDRTFDAILYVVC
jgi:hypothetical protein